MIPTPTKKPTSAEFAVLILFTAALLIILGVVALVMGFRAPAEKHALAVALESGGAWTLGIGATIGIGFWLFRRFAD